MSTTPLLKMLKSFLYPPWKYLRQNYDIFGRKTILSLRNIKMVPRHLLQFRKIGIGFGNRPIADFFHDQTI